MVLRGRLRLDSRLMAKKRREAKKLIRLTRNEKERRDILALREAQSRALKRRREEVQISREIRRQKNEPIIQGLQSVGEQIGVIDRKGSKGRKKPRRKSTKRPSSARERRSRELERDNFGIPEVGDIFG